MNAEEGSWNAMKDTIYRQDAIDFIKDFFERMINGIDAESMSCEEFINTLKRIMKLSGTLCYGIKQLPRSRQMER